MDAAVADGRKNGREPPGCRLDPLAADDKPKLRLDAAPGKLPREVEEPVVSMDAAAEVVEAMAAAEAESGWL
jgi:hypothetical protein